MSRLTYPPETYPAERPADVYLVEIGRIVVRGAAGIGAAQLRAQIESAVAQAVTVAELPAGRTARAAVSVDAGLLRGSPAAVADAVGTGVAAAVSGGRAHG